MCVHDHIAFGWNGYWQLIVGDGWRFESRFLHRRNLSGLSNTSADSDNRVQIAVGEVACALSDGHHLLYDGLDLSEVLSRGLDHDFSATSRNHRIRVRFLQQLKMNVVRTQDYQRVNAFDRQGQFGSGCSYFSTQGWNRFGCMRSNSL